MSAVHLTLATRPLLTWVERKLCRNATETPCMSSPETASQWVGNTIVIGYRPPRTLYGQLRDHQVRRGETYRRAVLTWRAIVFETHKPKGGVLSGLHERGLLANADKPNVVLYLSFTSIGDGKHGGFLQRQFVVDVASKKATSRKEALVLNECHVRCSCVRMTCTNRLLCFRFKFNTTSTCYPLFTVYCSVHGDGLLTACTDTH